MSKTNFFYFFFRTDIRYEFIVTAGKKPKLTEEINEEISLKFSKYNGVDAMSSWISPTVLQYTKSTLKFHKKEKEF